MSKLLLKDSIPFIEPVRSKNFMIALNDFIVKNQILSALIPYTADIFVFTYPVYLTWLYVYGISKNKDYYKEVALTIFFSAWVTAVTNMLIQFFVDKSRPEEAIVNKQNLILSHLPTEPFPSDHAAVSAAIAMSTMLRWIKNNDKTFIKLSRFFRLACLVMSFSRVAVAIHRPTDVIAWIGVWVIVSLILLSTSVWSRLRKTVIKPLIKIEKWLLKKIFTIVQEK